MRAFRTAVSCIALASAVACAPKQAALAPASPADVAAVAMIVARFDSCARTGALDVFLRYAADDAVLLIADQPTIIGKGAVRKFYKGFYGAFNIDMHHAPI